MDDLYKSKQKDTSFEEFDLWVNLHLGKDYAPFLTLIQEQKTDDTIITKVLQTIKERDLAYKISETALKVSEGKENFEELSRLVGLQDNEETTETSPFIEKNLKELYENQTTTPGLKWRLACLNTSLGSLRKGDFGFIFSRPETGKTTFLTSEVTYFASQTELPILWFNNEEQGNKVKIRCYEASLGKTYKKITSSLDESEEQYQKITRNNIKIFDSANIHKNTVKALVEEYKPSLIIFDQLDKIKGFTDDREDLRLGSIYIWARELAKEHAPVIGVTQADGTAEGKKYLTMDNVSNAKTAKQAEADWILGIGKSHDNGFEYIRHLNICKNKLLGDENSDEAFRHAKFDVLIQPEIGRYKDI